MKKYIIVVFFLQFISSVSLSQVLNITGNKEVDILISSKIIDKLMLDEVNFSNDAFVLEINENEKNLKLSVSIQSKGIVRKNYCRAFRGCFKNETISIQDIKKAFDDQVIAIKSLDTNKYKFELMGYETRAAFEFTVVPISNTVPEISQKFGISIILPTYNRISECLACVMMLKSRIAAPIDKWEVIVVADGCTDGSGKFFHDFFKSYPGFENFRVIWTDKTPGTYRNVGWPRNAGLRSSRFSHVATCDSDIYHLSDPVTPTLAVFERDENAVVTGNLYSVSAPDSVQFCESDQIKLELFKFLEFCETGWVSFKRQHYIDMGGNSERIDKWGYEDTDLLNRIEQFGLKRVRLPEIIYCWAFEKEKGHKKKWRDLWEEMKAIADSHPTYKRNEEKPSWGKYYECPVHSEGVITFTKGF